MSKRPDRDGPPKLPKGLKKQGYKCSNCYTKGSTEVKLKLCSRCKAVKYCSRDCQAAHWQKHKEACNQNVAHAESLQSVYNPLNMIPLPDGMSLTDMDQRLEKWVKFHHFTLMGATIHALALPRDLTRSRTHVVHILLSPRTDHNGSASKFFRVREARVLEVDEAMNMRNPWRASLEQFAVMRQESENTKRGTVAAAGVECPPLGVQFVPFGSLKGLSLRSMRIFPDWKEILIRDVENGKKFTRFGY